MIFTAEFWSSRSGTYGTTPEMVDLSRLTTVEASAALSGATVAILPVGATEQHGPHLELRTDIAIASEMARRLDADLGDLSVLCPPLPYGVSEHHMHFDGTLTLRPESFMAVVSDVIDSLAAHGIQRVIIVNGHGGNMDTSRLTARIALRDHDIRVAHAMWVALAADVIAEEMADRGRHNHACEIETSLAMALEPSLVRIELLTPSISADPSHTASDSPYVDLPRRFEEWTANGALGDPSRASIELGEKIWSTAHQRLLEFAREFAR